MEQKQDLLPPPPPPPPTPRADETLQILDLENLDMTLTTSDLGKNCKEFSSYATDISSVNEMDMAFVDSILELSKLESSKHELSKFELSKRQSSKYELSKFELSKLELSKQEQSSQESSIPELLKNEIPRYESSIIDIPKQEMSKQEGSICEVVNNEMSKFELTTFELSKEEEKSNQELSQLESSILEMPKDGIFKHESSVLDVAKQDLSQASTSDEANDKVSKLESPAQEQSKDQSSILRMYKRESFINEMSKPDLIEFATPAKPEFNISAPSPFTFMINKFSKLALATPPASTPNKPWSISNKNLITPFNSNNTPTQEDVSSIDLIQFSLDDSNLETSIQLTKNES